MSALRESQDRMKLIEARADARIAQNKLLDAMTMIDRVVEHNNDDSLRVAAAGCFTAASAVQVVVDRLSGYLRTT